MSTQEHPPHARSHLYSPATTVGAWAADKLTAFSGSWTFLGLHTVWFILWFVLHLDINLLTNIVSLEAIFLATLVLMSQSRTYQRDKARDDTEAFEVEKLVQQQEEIKQVQGEVKEISLQQNKILEEHKHILDQQTELLTLVHSLIETRKMRKKSPV